MMQRAVEILFLFAMTGLAFVCLVYVGRFIRDLWRHR